MRARQSSRRTWSRVMPVLALAGLTVAAVSRGAGAAVDAEAGVELFLHSAAEAFMGRDAAKVRSFFSENFAGPFRIPKIAGLALDQAMRNAESVDAGFETTAVKLTADRAFCRVDLDLEFHFRGGNDKKIAGPYIIWLDRNGADWTITDVIAEARDWSLPAGAKSVRWPDEAVTLPMPDGWAAYPVKYPEARRGVLFVSADLKAIIGVGVIGLPLPTTLTELVNNQKMVDQVFKGSKFVNQVPTQLAGSPAVAMGIEHNLGPRMARVLTVMMIRGRTLYALTLAVTPPKELGRFKTVFDRVCAGFALTGTPKAEREQTSSGTVANGRYTNPVYGFSIAAPAGWKVAPMSDQAAKKSGMLFGVQFRAPKGGSYVLAAAKELPGPVPLEMLQDGQMRGLRAVDPQVTSSDEKTYKINGLPARAWTYTFTLGKKRKRRQLFVMRGKRLFFLIAEAAPPSEFDKLAPDFARVFKSVQFTGGPGK